MTIDTLAPSRKTTFLLVLLAAAVRAVAAIGAGVIPRDGVTYVELARAVARGGPAAAFESIQHPLFPLLGGLFGGSETAVTLLAIFGGAVAVVPVMRIAGRLSGGRGALFAGVLYAVLPAGAQFTGAPLTEGLYIPLYLFAVDRALAAAENRSSALTGGLVAGLAYLTRPDGLVLLLGLPIALVARRRFAAAGLFLAGFLLLGGVYAGWMSAEAGRVVVSRKKARIERLVTPARVEAELGDARPRPGYGAAAADLARTWGEAVSWILVPFLAIGAVVAIRPDRRGVGGTLLLMLLLEAAARGQMLRSLGYLGMRHLLTAAVLSVPLAAAGILAIRARWRALVLVLVAAGLLIAAILPRNVEKRTLREAGRLILERSGPGAIVATWERPRIAYYAEGVNRRIEESGVAGLEGADWFAAVWERLDPGDRRTLSRRLAPDTAIPVGHGEWRVLLFRLR